MAFKSMISFYGSWRTLTSSTMLHNVSSNLGKVETSTAMGEPFFYGALFFTLVFCYTIVFLRIVVFYCATPFLLFFLRGVVDSSSGSDIVVIEFFTFRFGSSRKEIFCTYALSSCKPYWQWYL